MKIKNNKGEFHFYFEFEGGGNNSVWATGKKEALAKAVKEFPSMHPVYSTFKKMDEAFRNKVDKQNFMDTF
jgi:hypothetical protein